ncbi:MAG: alkaline phosphatase family protein [Anaerolineaceae bacterium]|nr:alkaline phosphatase family protein [Anaerolineaceae bacterium]
MTHKLENLALELENRIRGHRPLSLPAEWADELVFPAYGGLSIRNVPHTIAHLLGAALPGLTPLDEAVWGGDSPVGQVDRVVIFLTDGLGYLWLRQMMAEDDEVRDLVGEITNGSGALPLTSIAPTTTVAALTTLWTGASPAAHGIFGLRMYLRELSMLVNILSYKPAAGKLMNDILADWKLPPESFVPVAGLAESLAQYGIPTHLLLSYQLLGSGLSRILHRGVAHAHTHTGHTDLWPRLADVLAQTAGQRCCVSAYWPAVDSVAHHYGADNRYTRYEVKQQLLNLRDVLNAESAQDGRTLVMILADHGHHDAPQDIRLHENAHARSIFDAMRGGFGGETRLTHLYLREGQKQTVIRTLEEHFVGGLTWAEPEAALAAGLFGTETPHPEAAHRLGDLTVIARLNWQITDNFLRFPLISTHGGLSDWEMLVPLLWRRM